MLGDEGLHLAGNIPERHCVLKGCVLGTTEQIVLQFWSWWICVRCVDCRVSSMRGGHHVPYCDLVNYDEDPVIAMPVI